MSSNGSPENPSASDVAAPGSASAPPIVNDLDGTPPPRLGIIHLLAWLTIAAVLFGTNRSAHGSSEASTIPIGSSRIYQALDTIRLAVMAAGVVGLGAGPLACRAENRSHLPLDIGS